MNIVDELNVEGGLVERDQMGDDGGDVLELVEEVLDDVGGGGDGDEDGHYLLCHKLRWKRVEVFPQLLR